MNGAYTTLETMSKQESIVNSISTLLSNNTGTNGAIGVQYLYKSGYLKAIETEKTKTNPDISSINNYRLQIIDNLKTVNDKLKASVSTNNLRLFVKVNDYNNFSALLSRTMIFLL